METYVYGVMRAGPKSAPSAEGVDGQPVELVAGEGLAALVSDAPTLPVKANRRNLMAHSKVLQELIADRLVLPMQFGVVMPDRDAVASDLLVRHGSLLGSQLDALEPYVELDVRALCPEEDLLRAVVAERPEIAELRSRLEGTSAEATYYERIRLGELVAQGIADKRNVVGERIAVALEPLAAAREDGEILHDQMLANAAFLVDRDAVAGFDKAVASLGEELGAEVRLKYMGPLPPHNFVDMDLELEAEAWA